MARIISTRPGNWPQILNALWGRFLNLFRLRNGTRLQRLVDKLCAVHGSSRAFGGWKAPFTVRRAADGCGTRVRSAQAADGNGTRVRSAQAADGNGTRVRSAQAADGNGTRVRSAQTAAAEADSGRCPPTRTWTRAAADTRETNDPSSAYDPAGARTRTFSFPARESLHTQRASGPSCAGRRVCPWCGRTLSGNMRGVCPYCDEML